MFFWVYHFEDKICGLVDKLTSCHLRWLMTRWQRIYGSRNLLVPSDLQVSLTNMARWWFQTFIFSPLPGEIIQQGNIFQMGWFNHQLGHKANDLSQRDPEAQGPRPIFVDSRGIQRNAFCSCCFCQWDKRRVFHGSFQQPEYQSWVVFFPKISGPRCWGLSKLLLLLPEV